MWSDMHNITVITLSDASGLNKTFVSILYTDIHVVLIS